MFNGVVDLRDIEKEEEEKTLMKNRLKLLR